MTKEISEVIAECYCNAEGDGERGILKITTEIPNMISIMKPRKEIRYKCGKGKYKCAVLQNYQERSQQRRQLSFAPHI
jgi:hypothetical protein